MLKVCAAAAPSKRTTRPMVTGTSVLAVKYEGGVMMTADTLGSYGRMSRFTDLRRLVGVGDATLLGASGDISDLQEILHILDEKITADVCCDDGRTINAFEMYNYLCRVMYGRRSKANPLWNSLCVAGMVPSEDGGDKAFLGLVDLYGNSYEADFLATGFGSYLAMPLLRSHWQPGMSEADAKELLDRCMTVLFYRDCRTINRITAARITGEGPAEVSEPYALESRWDYQSFVNPKAGGDTAGSW